MKVLLDECCPSPLARALSGADVFTVEAAGMKGMKNGVLLAGADRVYDVLITADKNLQHQQNLPKRQIAIIELPFNSWKRLRALVPAIEAALKTIKPGQYLKIPATPTII